VPPRSRTDPADSVRGVLHPVGRLPARVYWRRRLTVLVVLIAVLGGGGWLAIRLLDPPGEGAAGGSAAATSRPAPTPALEQVLPSLASVRTPERSTTSPETRRSPASAPAGHTAGGPCTDEMITLTMRAPTRVTAGSTPTLEIIVRNVSEVPCVRRLDKDLQEVVLFDAAGYRVWGSNDCRPEKSDVRRTLAPREGVALEVVWSGLTSRPECAGERTTPKAGVYVLRGRLDDKKTPDRRIRVA
jgi:hypothetical protein